MKEQYPKKIGLFDITNTYSGVGFEEAYYNHQDFSVKIYKTKAGFAYSVIRIMPKDIIVMICGEKNLVQECVNEINEWLFLNDHIFVGKK